MGPGAKLQLEGALAPAGALLFSCMRILRAQVQLNSGELGWDPLSPQFLETGCYFNNPFGET